MDLVQATPVPTSATLRPSLSPAAIIDFDEYDGEEMRRQNGLREEERKYKALVSSRERLERFSREELERLFYVEWEELDREKENNRDILQDKKKCYDKFSATVEGLQTEIEELKGHSCSS